MYNIDFVNPLDNKEQLKLLETYANTKDINTRNILVEHNLKLILHRLNKKFYSYMSEFEDLFTLGTIGLIRAVENFDISKNIKFSTFAIKCIDSAIMNYVIDRPEQPLSLSETIGKRNDKQVELIDTLKDDVDVANEGMTEKILSEKLRILDQKTRDIIISYYGIFKNVKLTQAEIASKYNVSYPRIQQIIVKGLVKMKYSNEIVKRKSIYQVFNENSKTEVFNALKSLTKEELLSLRTMDFTELSDKGKEKELYLKIKSNL